MEKKEIPRVSNGMIILAIGIILGTFSAVIPFAEIGSRETWNILYNRGMLLGFMFASLGGAMILWHKIYYSSLLIGLASGILGELLISSYNLVCDGCIETYFYFLATFIVSFLLMIIILILRICIQ
jgi:hypothetical protein